MVSKADRKSQNMLLQLNKSLVLLCFALLCQVLKTNNGKCLLVCLISDINFALYTRFYSLSQASAGSKLIKQQSPQQ
jgi:hypothetical protein